MTKNEEIKYLTDLLLEASRWERSEGEVLSGLELEVQNRIRNLLGQDTVDSDGRCQSEPKRTGPSMTLEAQRKRRWMAEKSKTHVRVIRDGKSVWVLREHADKEPTSTGRKFKWVVKPEFASLYQES